MEDRTRPLGITIIAAFLGISAILALLGAIILGFFEVALAWGLWTLRPWAYWTTIIVEAIRVILGLYVVLILQKAIISGILSLIIPIIILVYLVADRNVRAAFSSSST